MKIFGMIATILAYSSIGMFVVCMMTSLILATNSFNIGRFYEKFQVFYKNICFFFCLPLYGISFLLEGISEKDSILDFVMATTFFLAVVVLINLKKIKKIIERRKKKWRFWR